MEDSKIIELFWNRDEQAIEETQSKYGGWCQSIAYRILRTREDTEECVADTFMSAWDHIPPQRPKVFRAWIGRITRNLALTRYRSLHAEKRGGGETAIALEELEFCVSGSDNPESVVERETIAAAINRFLEELSYEHRGVFMRRYWYLDSIDQVADRYDMTQSQVTSLLYRQRQRLKEVLSEEGIAV